MRLLVLTYLLTLSQISLAETTYTFRSSIAEVPEAESVIRAGRLPLAQFSSNDPRFSAENQEYCHFHYNSSDPMLLWMSVKEKGREESDITSWGTHLGVPRGVWSGYSNRVIMDDAFATVRDTRYENNELIITTRTREQNSRGQVVLVVSEKRIRFTDKNFSEVSEASYREVEFVDPRAENTGQGVERVHIRCAHESAALSS